MITWCNTANQLRRNFSIKSSPRISALLSSETCSPFLHQGLMVTTPLIYVFFQDISFLTVSFKNDGNFKGKIHPNTCIIAVAFSLFPSTNPSFNPLPVFSTSVFCLSLCTAVRIELLCSNYSCKILSSEVVSFLLCSQPLIFFSLTFCPMPFSYSISHYLKN